MIARIIICVIAGVLLSFLLSIRFTVDPRTMTRFYAQLYRPTDEPSHPERVVVTKGFNFAQVFRSTPFTEVEALPQGMKGIALSDYLPGAPFTLGNKEHPWAVAQSYQGWPLKCFVVEWRQVVRDHQYVVKVDGGFVAADGSRSTRGVPVTNRAVVLPFKPITPLLVLNSLLWGSVLLAVWEGSIKFAARKRRRVGRCSCGYVVADLPRCPECGREREAARLRRP